MRWLLLDCFVERIDDGMKSMDGEAAVS
jgi:hypothetical protein